MTTAHLFTIAWSPDPSVIGGSLALAVAYLMWLRLRLSARAIVFLAGVAVMLFALVGPLDRIGELYLFSVHMLQHLLLILVVPPLLLWGLPPDATRRLLRVGIVHRVERVLGRPLVALPVAIVTLWGWHLPALYDLALRNEGVHALEHLLFLATATMFWWPVLRPEKERRLSPPAAMAYLFAGMASDAGLGVALTFSPTPLYAFYVHPPDPYGALPLIRETWRVSVLSDQQMGGLAMWIPGGIFYIVAILAEFGLWFREPEADESATLGSGPQPDARQGQESLGTGIGRDSGAPERATSAAVPAVSAQRIAWHDPAAIGGILEGAR
jgi:putative membrane protein